MHQRQAPEANSRVPNYNHPGASSIQSFFPPNVPPRPPAPFRHNSHSCRKASAPMPGGDSTGSHSFAPDPRHDSSGSDSRQHMFRHATALVPLTLAPDPGGDSSGSGQRQHRFRAPPHLFRVTTAVVPTHDSTCSDMRQHSDSTAADAIHALRFAPYFSPSFPGI
jgi:hypothetical protein